MPLVNVAGIDRRLTAANEMLGQVRDVGGCLEHLLASYDRMVRGLLGADVPLPDPHGRLRAISSRIEDVSKRVQEMLILAHEDRQAEVYAAFDRAGAQRKSPTAAAPPLNRRPTVVTPLRPASGQRFASVTVFSADRVSRSPAPETTTAPR
jgi:hypothetical protein